MNELLNAALDYAAKGWAVFPVRTKTKNGYYRYDEYLGEPNEKYPEGNPYSWEAQATTDPQRIKKYWSQHPDANVCIACGSKSNGLVIVDLDLHEDQGIDGAQTLKQFEQSTGCNIDSRTVCTGTGGQHIYFSSKVEYSNGVKLMPGIDVRGEGGYAVAPPSVNEEGRPYFWDDQGEGEDPVICVQDSKDAEYFLSEYFKQKKEKKSIDREAGKLIPKGERMGYMISQAGLMMNKCYAIMDNDTMLKALMEKAHKELEQDPSLDYKYLEKNLKRALGKFRAMDAAEREKLNNIDWSKCKAAWSKAHLNEELPDPIPWDEVLKAGEQLPEGVPKKSKKNRAKPKAKDLKAIASSAEDGNNIADVIPMLSLSSDDEIATTSYNYLTILRNDKHFENICFNLLRHFPEKIINGKRIQWVDADDAAARIYIEKNYGINNIPKFNDAFLQYQMEHAFNPLTDAIEKIKWDGVKRTEQFFIKWMGCEDNDYSREVSRLFFAGGINRAFRQGCKFDDVVVLISSQGGGKSTICEWLALDLEFYSSSKTISGQKGLEAIQGKWIVELEELLAVIANEQAGTKVEEAAKAYLSGKVDYYRLPYTHRPQDVPRTNIFIGTTNRDTFLTDKTGNRRWFPLICRSSAYYLYDHEAEVKADIQQCWAEMKAAYDLHEDVARPYADKLLLDAIREEQSNAECDDWREGVIAQYIRKLDKVCCLQIWREALNADQKFVPALSQKDSRDIGAILVNRFGWIKGYPEDFGEALGKQRSYKRPPDPEPYFEPASTDFPQV